MHERLRMLLDMLVGQMVVVRLRGGERYVGVLSAASTVSDEVALVLSLAQSISNKDGGIKLGEVMPSLVVPGAEILEVDVSGAKVSSGAELETAQRRGSGFRTDTEISAGSNARSDGRKLQRWDDGPDDGTLPGANGSSQTSSLEQSTDLGPWDQFAANEARFGIKSNYEETMYTTRLDRSGKDFKAREKEAERLAKEILEGSTSNPHVAEERNQIDPQEVDEEARYGAVIREQQQQQQQKQETKQPPPQPPKSAEPKTGLASATPTGASPSLASTPVAAHEAVSRPNKELTADFRQFVSAERERLVVRKAELAKKEKQSRLADLKVWAQTFQLKTPVPEDVANMRRYAAPTTKGMSNSTSTGGVNVPTGAVRNHSMSSTSSTSSSASLKPSLSSRDSYAGGWQGSSNASGAPLSSSQSKSDMEEVRSKLASMTIPAIPPFKKPEEKKPPSKLNVKASAFNPQAATFTPGAKVTPTQASATPAKLDVPDLPFFGKRELTNRPGTTSMRIMDEFRAPKTKKLGEASKASVWWSYTGRPYRQLMAASGVYANKPLMPPPFINDAASVAAAAAVAAAANAAPMPPPIFPMAAAYAPGLSPTMQHIPTPATGPPHGSSPPTMPRPMNGKPPHSPHQQSIMLPPPPSGSPHTVGQQPYTVVYPIGQYRFPARPSYVPPADPHGTPLMYRPTPPMPTAPFAPPGTPGGMPTPAPHGMPPMGPYANMHSSSSRKRSGSASHRGGTNGSAGSNNLGNGGGGKNAARKSRGDDTGGKAASDA